MVYLKKITLKFDDKDFFDDVDDKSQSLITTLHSLNSKDVCI